MKPRGGKLGRGRLRQSFRLEGHQYTAHRGLGKVRVGSLSTDTDQGRKGGMQ